MVSIVLASHGDLAAGIKQTGSMVFGDQPSVAVVSLEPSTVSYTHLTLPTT